MYWVYGRRHGCEVSRDHGGVGEALWLSVLSWCPHLCPGRMKDCQDLAFYTWTGQEGGTVSSETRAGGRMWVRKPCLHPWPVFLAHFTGVLLEQDFSYLGGSSAFTQIPSFS